LVLAALFNAGFSMSIIDNEMKNVTKILIIGGGTDAGLTTKTELINLGLSAPKENCTLPDYPLEVYGAVGFYTDQGPTVCGGESNYKRIKECYTLLSNGWTESNPISTSRRYASAINIDSTETLILGGIGQNGLLKSSEVMSANGAKKGKDLPVTMYGQCSMKGSKRMGLVGGGKQDGSYSSKTYYLNMDTMEFTEGPSMQSAREKHGCAALHLGGKTYGIMTGGYNGGYLDSTEFLAFDQPNPTWTDGPKLPRKLNGLSLVETSEGIFAIGGFDGQMLRKEILKLDCPGDKIENCEWKEQEQELEIGRSVHVAIPLPSSFSCPEVGMNSAAKMSTVSIVTIVFIICLHLH